MNISKYLHMEHIFAQGAGCTDTVAGALLAAAAPAPGSGGNADSGGAGAVVHWCCWYWCTTAGASFSGFKWEASGRRCTWEGGAALPMQCATIKVQRV